jgi:hypothetical protein
MASGQFHAYAKGLLALGGKLENLPSDALKCALLSSYTVGATQQTAEFYSDVVTGGVGVEVANGNGYTTGGVALSGASWAVTAANSWSITYATATAYNVGDVVIPGTPNGYLYQCVVAGTTGGAAPTYPTTVGMTVTDSGSVTWLNIGTAVTVLTCSNVVWTSSSTGFTASYALVYDSTPGTAGTNPVIAYLPFSASVSPSGGGTLTVTIPTAGILPLGSS